MATDTRSLSAFLTGDTEFRAWAAGIHAQIQAMGWVNTADTGQVDLTTATRPSANTYAGYKIYRMADTLQATAPVYLKLEYGVSSPQDKPQLRMQLATSTNGAGVVGAQQGGQRNFATVSSKTAGATLNSYCSGDTNRLALCNNFDPSNNAYGMGLFIERLKDENGDDTADGVFYCTIGGSSIGASIMTFSPKPNITSTWGSMPCIASLWSQPYSVGSDVYLLPHCPVLWKAYPPLRGTCTYRFTDITELVPITIDDFYGESHTYLPMGDGFTTTLAAGFGTATDHTIAILWE